MSKFKGKRVLITGAARGIGKCTAEEFAKAGAELVLTDIDGLELEATARDLSTQCVVHSRAVDVSARDQVDEMAAWIIDDLGGLDVLINNAGVGHHGELAETSFETWNKLLAVNFMGPLYHIYAFLPHFKAKRSGQIANISSGQAFFKLPTWGAYATIKAALGAVSEIFHYELGKYGIKVTTVYPFMSDTGFYDDIEGDTVGGRMAMQLLPLYSMSADRVGRIVYKATLKATRVEMVTVLNDVGFYAQMVPFASGIISKTTDFLMAPRAK